MVLLPVAAREVREASRQTRTYAWRGITASIALALMAFIAWVTRYSGGQGQSLFIGVSTVAYIYCLIAGVVRTADTIAEEKRENTLGLLFLTDLKGWDIILGKLLSSTANCLFGLLALIPMLAIPMLMGGVQMVEFVRVILTLLVTLLLSISWGFLISSLFRLSVVTISSGLAIIILFAGGLPLLSVLLNEEYNLRTIGVIVFILSPTHCHMFSFDVSAPAYLHHYWTSLAVNFGIALINLRLAIFFLPRFWQEAPKNKKTENWRNRIRALRFGKAKAKKRLRTRLLNQNPFFWLANREQISSAGLMFTSVVILIGAMICGLASARGAWRGVEEIMVSWMIGLILVHIVIAFRMAMSASYRLAEDRRSGALELLLGTEVSVRELLRGYWMALGRQFFGPMMIVIFGGAFALMMLLTLFSDELHTNNIFQTLIRTITFSLEARNTGAGLGFLTVVSIQLMLAINWVALILVGMWLGLREKRSGVATWFTLALVYVPPWAVLIAGMIAFVETGIGQGFGEEECIVIILVAGWLLGGSHALFLSLWARSNLITRFREAAADRYMGSRRIAWPKLRRIVIRFAVAGACIVLLFYVARYFIDRRGEKAWAQALAAYPNFQLQKADETKTIPDQQNLAKAPFFKALTASGGRKIITWNLTSAGAAFYGEFLQWEWPNRRRANLPRIEEIYVERKILTNREATSAATVLKGLSEYDLRLDDLREEARARPLLQYPRPLRVSEVSYGPFMYTGQSLDIHSSVRHLIQTLALRTSAQIAMGSTNTDDLFLALRLADGVKEFPQGMLQHHEILLDCVQPIYDGLTLRVWKNDELKKIQDHFAAIDLWAEFEMYRENYLRQTLTESQAVTFTRRGAPRVGQSWLARQAPVGFRQKWQADTLHWGMTALPKIADTKARRIDMQALREMPHTRPTPPTATWYPDQIVNAIRSLAFTQTMIDEIVVACGIERYRNDHDALPGKIEEIVPKYLSAVPHDVFTGEPMHYRVNKEKKSYVIYSVGTDLEDNRGNGASMMGSWMIWQDQPGTDWAWNSDSIDPPPIAPKKKKNARN